MIAAIRGTQDILQGAIERWQFVEQTACRVFEQYGYAEVRTPIIEREELFAKGTGETTDIVLTEMYAFADKDGERITLRPEATPSLVRAFVEHSLEQAMPVP
jgi:histidyl-tRNA synthetase